MPLVLPVSTPKRFDAGPGSGGRIGLLVLGRDPVCEVECNQALGSGDVTLHVARIPDPPDFTRDALANMGVSIAAAAGMVLEGDRLDVVALACSAAATAVGREALSAMLRAERPSLKVTDPGAAAVALLKSAGVRRLALLLTTADGSVNRRTIDAFEAEGFEVLRALTLELADDKAMSTLSLDSISQALATVDDPSADVVFVPCTAMRTWQAIRKSKAVGRCVLTGNRAMMIHAECLATGKALPSSLECLTAMVE